MTHQTFLAVKGVERDGTRWIEGWATTGTKDRVADIVVPEGAVFTLPIPLLFAHDHAQPIGAVTQASVTKAGIKIRAKLTAGVQKAEEVWTLILDGALTACSIGFQSLKSTPLGDGGVRFDQWSWYELSIVSVGANPDARISAAKCAAFAVPQSQKAVATKPASVPVKSATNSSAKPVTLSGLKAFGETLVDGISEAFTKAIDKQNQRIKELETIVEVQQKKLDVLAGSSLKFAGEFQAALDYTRGSVVTYKDYSYVALKDISAGKAEPPRQGSGWAVLS